MSQSTLLEAKQILVGHNQIAYAEGGKGPVVVFLHGLEGRNLVRPFLQEMAQHYHVIAPDLPGFGQSIRDAEVETMRDMVYVMLDFFTALGLGSVRIVGESLGGWLAAEMAVDYWRDFPALALLDPLGIALKGLPTPDIFRLRPLDYARLLSGSPEKSEEMASRWDGEGLAAYLSDREMLARLAWHPRLYNPSLGSRLARIQCPSALLWGEEDQILPLAYGAAWRSHMPNARWATVPSGGHALVLDQPRAAAELLTEFFQSLS